MSTTARLNDGTWAAEECRRTDAREGRLLFAAVEGLERVLRWRAVSLGNRLSGV